jgi:hypothetical protein
MVLAMKAVGLIIKGMDLEYIITQMAILTKGTGTSIKGMVKERIRTQKVVQNIKVQIMKHCLSVV